MNKIIINGDFLCRNLTGIERFATEICIRLDRFAPKGLFTIYVPSNAKRMLPLLSIDIVQSSHSCTVFPIWEHIYFSSYVKKMHAVPLDFSNVTPLCRPGIVFIHDIYARLYPEDFRTFRDKLVRLYSCAMYRHAAKKAVRLITVSAYSRHQLAETYHIPENSIDVVHNGWDHFKTVMPDTSVFSTYPALKQGSYFFTLGSLSKRKNLKWIASYAAAHQDQTFAVSGKAISGLVPDELSDLQQLPNVILVGYVSDGQVKALMEHCRAFVFPSYYEGFGIPPLEALSCGVPVIVANAASLPELYEGCVHYIDPDKTDTDLEVLLNNPVESPERLLAAYTYENAAQNLYTIIKKMV